jgi:3-dehydroquinate synthetase
MRFALRLAGPRGLPAADGARLSDLLDRLDLPPLPPFTPDELLAVLARDKKAVESGVRWVLPRRLGAWAAVEVASDEVRGELVEFLAV